MSSLLLLEKLKELQKRNDKMEFIRQHKDDEDFMYFLKVLLDDTIILKVKTIPEEYYTNSVGTLGANVEDFKNLVNFLVRNNRSTKTMEEIKKFLKMCNKLEAPIYAGILTKTYKVGITGSTVNKALGKPFVAEFKLEKAEPFSEELLDWSSKFILGEEKYDGVRCAIFYEKGKVTALSYNNKEISLTHIAESVKTLAKNLKVDNIMLDGELLSTSRVSTSGLVNKLIKSPDRYDDKDLKFKLFHYMSIDEFKMRKDSKTLHDVAVTLGKWEALGYGTSNLEISTYYFLHNVEEIESLFKTVRSNGGEGIMLKIPTAHYEWKRSKTWIKMKSIYSTTLKVVDIYLAGDNTKYKGLVGGLICETKDGFQVAVGGGLSDDDRVVYLDRSRIVGKLVEVIFTDINYSEDGKLFLDFPRLKSERFDKTEPDTLEQMIREIPKRRK